MVTKKTESVKPETETLNPEIEAVSSEAVPSQEEVIVEENPNEEVPVEEESPEDIPVEEESVNAPNQEPIEEVLGNELESAELVEFIFWVNFKHEETYYDKGNSVLMDKETAEMYQRNVLGEIRVSN